MPLSLQIGCQFRKTWQLIKIAGQTVIFFKSLPAIYDFKLDVTLINRSPKSFLNGTIFLLLKEIFSVSETTKMSRVNATSRFFNASEHSRLTAKFTRANEQADHLTVNNHTRKSQYYTFDGTLLLVAAG